MAGQGTAADTLVLGIGNVLWADEGFGVRCVEYLLTRYTLPPSVLALDGGTQGLYLLPYVQSVRRLIVFDAIDYGLEPGALRLIENEEVPRFMGAKKMSLHQTGFQDVIAAAELTGRCPSEMLLIGVQPEQLDDYGGSLRPRIRERLPLAVTLAVRRLRRWKIPVETRIEDAGHSVERARTSPARGPTGTSVCRPSEFPSSAPEVLNGCPNASYAAGSHSPLEINRYESGRPSAEDACRIGDERVLALRTGAGR